MSAEKLGALEPAERALPRDHPLLSRDDVVWTPHRGSATAGTRKAMADLAIRNLILGIDGLKLAACCNGLQ